MANNDFISIDLPLETEIYLDAFFDECCSSIDKVYIK